MGGIKIRFPKGYNSNLSVKKTYLDKRPGCKSWYTINRAKGSLVICRNINQGNNQQMPQRFLKMQQKPYII